MTLVSLSNQIVMVAEEADYKSTEAHMIEYIESVQALEEAMEPFKEQKRELRKEYEENKWLSKEEMRMAVKAYRLLKNDTDLSVLIDMCDSLKGKVKVTPDES